MGVEEKLAFLLSLSDIGSGGEVEHLGRGLRVRTRRRIHCKSNNRERKAGFESCAPRRKNCRPPVLHVSLPVMCFACFGDPSTGTTIASLTRSEEHTSELQSPDHL